VIGRFTPDTPAGDAHGAEAQTVDLEIAADLEGPGLRSIQNGHGLSSRMDA
jgi:hypothetical protein